jgi:hypothetical protein
VNTIAERFEEIAERAEALGLRVEHLVTTDSPRPNRWDFFAGDRRLKRTWSARVAWKLLDDFEAASRMNADRAVARGEDPSDV